MPQTLSAKKALRQDRRRTAIAAKTKLAYKKAIKEARQGKTKTSLSKAFSLLDQAAKKRVIHKKRANRLKKRLTKLIKTKPPKRKTNRRMTRKKA